MKYAIYYNLSGNLTGKMFQKDSEYDAYFQFVEDDTIIFSSSDPTLRNIREGDEELATITVKSFSKQWASGGLVIAPKEAK